MVVFENILLFKNRHTQKKKKKSKLSRTNNVTACYIGHEF